MQNLVVQCEQARNGKNYCCKEFEKYSITEYSLPFDALRLIKAWNFKFQVQIYTYDPSFTFNPSLSNKYLLYTSYINEKLDWTSIQIDLEKSTFLYKSFQIFPDSPHASHFLEELIKKHDSDFAKIRECLKGISETTLPPNVVCRELVKSLH